MLILKIDEFSFDILYSSILIIFIFLLSIFIISKNSILKNNQYTTLGLIIFSGFIYKTQLNSFTNTFLFDLTAFYKKNL
jgi:type II secretory pathway component PulF